MIGTFRKFIKDRKLELSADKSKMLVFNRSRGKINEKWRWGKTIEEVQDFKYLGFKISNNGKYKEHVKEPSRKGKMAARKVWRLRERICRNGFKRRWIWFRYLVQSMMVYGVEIWGWGEKEELERIMFDYVRWLFGLDFCTPRYIITKGLGMEKLKVEWGIRARRYEAKIKTGVAGKIAKEYWKEKEGYSWQDDYGREREKYYNRNGWGIDAES